jgi:predicted RNA-binding Zn-ribbon protein involved in translation (DUF1610 family)
MAASGFVDSCAMPSFPDILTPPDLPTHFLSHSAKNQGNQMQAAVKCQQCGREIANESTSGDSGERKPCPDCGSVSRAFSLYAEEGIFLVDTVNAVLTKSSPSLFLQAVVTFGNKTSEGGLIEAVTAPWLEILKMIKKDQSIIYQISPRKWEELIAGWYKDYGFDEVTLTPRSGDLGRDVIAVKHGILSVRILRFFRDAARKKWPLTGQR